MTQQEVLSKLSAAWEWVILVGGHWFVLSLVANALLRHRSAEAWVTLAESKPVLGAAVRFLRSWGVDPVLGLKVGAAGLGAKAAATQVGLAAKTFLGDASPPSLSPAALSTPPPDDAHAPPAPRTAGDASAHGRRQ